MDLIKHVEYNKEYQGQLFLIELKYGMKDDKTNHMLLLKIWHITDKTKGVKNMILEDDIIDITSRPNIYQPSSFDYESDFEKINSFINEQIISIVRSNHIKKEFIDLLDELGGK